MAEATISPVVDLMLSRMVSVVGENISLILGFKKELGRLKDELEMIRAVLRDAMAKKDEDEAVKLWLKRLEEFAFQAADVLDEFAYEALRRKVKKVNHFMPSSILSKRKIAKKIKEIFASLDIINKQASSYGLQRRGGHVSPPPPRVLLDRETDSFVDSSDVVGRETEISEIIKMLTCQSDQQSLSVLPIVGMGGIGKTTLAKLIYNDERIKGYLSKRIWVCVSSDFDVKRLLKEMLESLKKEKCHVDTMDAILEGLQKELSGEKYLLVLDDVWSEDHNKWNDFVSRLRSVNTTGSSKIVVTTRITNVASIVDTFRNPYCMKGLSNDECWSIFSARAFANGGVFWSSDLEDIGRRIVKKCSGLPLAAKVAGSMMRFKKDKHEWLSIANSMDSDGDKSEVLPILKLSFDNLPSQSLKQCFSYCSILIKDFNIDKKDLINYWMALGYLQPNEENNVEMEDIGNMYFNILVQCSLFQDIQIDTFGNIIGCKMHDMVHDLAQYIAKPEVFTLESNTRLATYKIHHTRHLASYRSGESFDNIRQGADKLHTLFMSPIEDDRSLVDFKYLRVLKLNLVGEKNILTSISELIHLRYLELSTENYVILPDSITNLYHLQTLRLTNFDCLPKDFSNLISLRHLYFNNLMPFKIGSLTCLRTLSAFIVGKEKGRQIEELRYLENLGGRLEIRDLEKVRSKDDAERANLSRKTKIDQLLFAWSKGNSVDEGVIEGLQPHPNLKSLEVLNFQGHNFPVWMMNMTVNVGGSLLLLENLVKISLNRCHKVEGIPMLGQLPLLRYLHLEVLWGIKYIGESFYGYNKGSGGVASSSWKPYGVESSQSIILFPALKELILFHLTSLEEWMGPNLEEAKVFPCLEKLSISMCPKLKTAPNHFPCLKELVIDRMDSGLPVINICSNLTTLTHLDIKNVMELTSLPDGLFHNNNQHLMKLEIIACPNLKSIPSLEGLKSLKTLRVTDCGMLESPPQGLQSCTSLDKLILRDCNNVMVFFEDIQALPSLSYLEIGGFYPTLTSVLDRFQHPHCVSLRWLILRGRHEWDTLPEQIQYLTALTCLDINYFGVEALPNWFGNLESLEELELYGMNQVSTLGGSHGTTDQVKAIGYLPLSAIVRKMHGG